MKTKVCIVANNMGLNGISTVIYNYASYLDKSIFEVDILAGLPIDDYYEHQLKCKGVNIIKMPSRKKRLFTYIWKINCLFQTKKYNVIHINGNSATMALELLFAKIHNIKKRIVHSHNVRCDHYVCHLLLKPLFSLLYTDALACSPEAGKWIFNHEFDVLPNAFEYSRFYYDEARRKNIREELNLKDKIVIGHIGRFNNQKNQEFIIKVFNKLITLNNRMVLMLIGDGPNFKVIQNFITNSKYKSRIVLLGEKSNAFDFYNAFDIFVFPSKFEGLGIVGIEAQLNGLPCIFSNNVPRVVDIGGKIDFLSLNDENEWVNKIIDYCKDENDRYQIISSHNSNFENYNIENNVKLLEGIYLN